MACKDCGRELPAREAGQRGRPRVRCNYCALEQELSYARTKRSKYQKCVGCGNRYRPPLVNGNRVAQKLCGECAHPPKHGITGPCNYCHADEVQYKPGAAVCFRCIRDDAVQEDVLHVLRRMRRGAILA